MRNPSTDPNDPLWQLRTAAQRRGDNEQDKMLIDLQVERSKVHSILDALITTSTADMTMIDMAEAVSERFATLEMQRDDLLDKFDGMQDGAVASDGYRAFATALDWKYPDGEPMPAWHQLPADLQDAFVAFCKAVTTP